MPVVFTSLGHEEGTRHVLVALVRGHCCVNQCTLPGPRLRTGEPLTSPLP